MPAGRPAVPGLTRFLVTCEHGGKRVPARYRSFFAGREALLASHRGYDPGALVLARELARALQAPLLASSTTRLLVELNRSPRHPHLYSEALRQAPESVRQEVFARHYLPYRRRAEALVAAGIDAGRRVVHISSHSFAPVLAGEVRNADIGLLYDPGRPGEAALCRAWRERLRQAAPALKVRRNYPYTGRSDGLCRWLRRRFPAAGYVGVELEINQKFVLAGGAPWRELRATVVASLLQALG